MFTRGRWELKVSTVNAEGMLGCRYLQANECWENSLAAKWSVLKVMTAKTGGTFTSDTYSLLKEVCAEGIDSAGDRGSFSKN